MHRGIALSVGLVAIFALAGCAPAVTSGTPSPTHTTAESEPTPTPVAPPELSDLVITPDGLGALAIGSPVPDQSSGSALVTWNATKCGATGAWVPNYPDSLGLDQVSDVPFVVGTTSKSDPVKFIRVASIDIHSAKGIHIGSTAAELTAAYPTFDHTVDEGLVVLYSINGANSQLVFEFAKQGSIPADDGTVVQIEAESGTGTPVGAAGTDGFGYCPQ